MADDVIVNVETPQDETQPEDTESEPVEVDIEEEIPEWREPLLELAQTQRETIAEMRDIARQMEQDRQASLTLTPTLLETNTRLMERLEGMATEIGTLRAMLTPPVPPEMPPTDTQNQGAAEIVPSEVESEPSPEVSRPRRRAI